jgi:tetratricopeptide (TPR) repeat protein
MITLAVIVELVGNTLFGYYAEKGLDKLSRKKDDFSSELNRVIFETLEEYASTHPIPNQGERFPFYHSQRVIEELLKFRVMHAKEYNVEDLINSIKLEPKVIPPSKEQIETFYSLFISKAESSEILKKLEINKTFDKEIFYISKRLDELSRGIDSLISAFNSDVMIQWKSRIEVYVRTMKEFKLQTALNLLQNLKSSFTETVQTPPSETKAIVEYQIGLCENFLQQAEVAAKTFIRAYLLNPKNESYKEQAAFMYYRLRDLHNAQKLSDELLSADPFNSVAWAVTLLLADDFFKKLDDVPFFVKKDPRFIRVLVQSLNAERRQPELQLLREQAMIPSLDQYLPFELTIDTYSSHLFWIQLSIHDFFQHPGLDFNKREHNVSAPLEVLNSLTQIYSAKIKGTEIDSDNEAFYFLEAYSTFMMTGDLSTVYKVKETFSKLKDPEPSLVAFCANALQFAEDEDAAIRILEQYGGTDINCLTLLAFCNIKIGNAEGYVATTHKLLHSLKIVPTAYLQSHLNRMIQACSYYRQADFTFAEFIDGKKFGSETEKTFASTIASLLFEGRREDNVDRLKKLSPHFETPPYLSIVACSYYFIGEYELAVTTFRKFLNYQEADRDLLFYIYSLYNTKKDSAELLKLLEHWRLHFEFHPQFLRAEFQLRGEMLDYKTCVKIAAFFLERKPDDEDMLANYAMSLYSEGSEESNQALTNYVETLRDFSYGSVINVGRVAVVLTKRGHFATSIELLYRYALQPENKALRLDYYMACLSAAQRPETNVMEEYQVAAVGTFVKYELNRKIYFTEISESNQNNSLPKAFLGKSVLEVIIQKRQLTNEEDHIKILRIMNKYLYLHDQILEEVKNDPYSGIPMAAIEFGSDNGEDIIATMQKMFGEIGTEQRDYQEAQIERYYKRDISFSELVFSALKDDYLAAYYYLVFQRKGIVSVPTFYYRHDIPTGTRFALDFSSLIIVFQSFRHRTVEFPGKLVISLHIVDRLRRALEKRKGDISPAMSVSITQTEVSVFEHQQSTTENDIKYLEDLLAWISQYCEIASSARSMDLTRSLNYMDDQKVFSDYVVNTLLVAEDQGCMLVTDDTFYMKSGFSHPSKQCSSEMFIKHISQSVESLSEFLANKYIGFSPNAKQLDAEYQKNAAGSANQYRLCLDNINLVNNPGMAIPAIDHVRHIAVEGSIIQGQQQKDITLVFTELMRGVEPGLRKSVEAMTRLKCMLLGQRLDMILHCFKLAQAHLNSENA